MRKSIDALPGMKRYRRDMIHGEDPSSKMTSGLQSRKKSIKDFNKRVDAIYAHNNNFNHLN